MKAIVNQLLVAGLYLLFFGGSAYAIPMIGNVNPVTTLTNTTELLLFSENVTDATGISNAWVEISSPTNYSQVITISNRMEEVSAGRFELDYAGFTVPGDFNLNFYVRNLLGEISDPVATVVTQADITLTNMNPSLPDRYEPDDVQTNATEAFVPVFQIHSLHNENDCDWIRFFAESNLVYDIETFHGNADSVDTSIEIYKENLDGSITLVDEIDDFGRDEGEFIGLDFPETGFYYVKVCQAEDPDFVPGDYFIIIYVPAGFVGINVLAWDVLNSRPISGASVSVTGYGVSSTDSDGYVRHAGAGQGHYTVDVSKANYVAVGGSIRRVRPDQFATLTYQNVTLAVSTYVTVGMVPVSTVSASVFQKDFGLPVQGAEIGFFLPSNNGLFRRYPWSGGIDWVTDADGHFPGNVILPASSMLEMVIHRANYTDLRQNIVTSGTGGNQSLGNLELTLNYSGNSIPDIWEVGFGLPLNVDPNEDSDGDGVSHYGEFVSGTSPTNSTDFFFIPEPTQMADGSVLIRWLARGNRGYRLFHADKLSPPPAWVPIYTPARVPEAQEMEYLVPAGGQNDQGFFRIEAMFP